MFSIILTVFIITISLSFLSYREHQELIYVKKKINEIEQKINKQKNEINKIKMIRKFYEKRIDNLSDCNNKINECVEILEDKYN